MCVQKNWHKRKVRHLRQPTHTCIGKGVSSLADAGVCRLSLFLADLVNNFCLVISMRGPGMRSCVPSPIRHLVDVRDPKIVHEVSFQGNSSHRQISLSSGVSEGANCLSLRAERPILSGVSPCPSAIDGLKCTSARAHDGCPASETLFEVERYQHYAAFHTVRLDRARGWPPPAKTRTASQEPG